MAISALVTIPPYAPFLGEVLGHPIVSGVRLNTVMPVAESLESVVGRLGEASAKAGKELWVDLKCRQLRVKGYGVPPFTEIELTHRIEVDCPVNAYFSDGTECARVLRADGYRLIMQDGPKRMVGPGESVNIPHPSLHIIDGYFTSRDRDYIRAGLTTGLHSYILSFVEQQQDIAELTALDPAARMIAKIESKKGMGYVASGYDHSTRLMAARGDLYVELARPHQIVGAVEEILRADPDAVVASRLFHSLADSLEPSCEDIGDVDNLLRMGYKTFMFGDDICQRRDSIISGLNLFAAMAERYQ